MTLSLTKCFIIVNLSATAYLKLTICKTVRISKRRSDAYTYSFRSANISRDPSVYFIAENLSFRFNFRFIGFAFKRLNILRFARRGERRDTISRDAPRARDTPYLTHRSHSRAIWEDAIISNALIKTRERPISKVPVRILIYRVGHPLTYLLRIYTRYVARPRWLAIESKTERAARARALDASFVFAN